jgi:hypothetical protein
MSFTLIQLDFKIIVRKLLIAAGNHLWQIAGEPIEERLRYIGWEALDEEASIEQSPAILSQGAMSTESTGLPKTWNMSPEGLLVPKGTRRSGFR